jgi:hypothetical protein
MRVGVLRVYPSRSNAISHIILGSSAVIKQAVRDKWSSQRLSRNAVPESVRAIWATEYENLYPIPGCLGHQGEAVLSIVAIPPHAFSDHDSESQAFFRNP